MVNEKISNWMKFAQNKILIPKMLGLCIRRSISHKTLDSKISKSKFNSFLELQYYGGIHTFMHLPNQTIIEFSELMRFLILIANLQSHHLCIGIKKEHKFLTQFCQSTFFKGNMDISKSKNYDIKPFYQLSIHTTNPIHRTHQ